MFFDKNDGLNHVLLYFCTIQLFLSNDGNDCTLWTSFHHDGKADWRLL